MLFETGPHGVEFVDADAECIVSHSAVMLGAVIITKEMYEPVHTMPAIMPGLTTFIARCADCAR